MPPRARADPLQTLTFIAVFGIVLAWVSYLWEKASGVTFVLSKRVEYGQLSTATHLARTLRNAEFITVLCAAYLMLWFLLLRPRR